MHTEILLKSHVRDGLVSVWSFETGYNTLVRGPMLSSKEQLDAWLKLVRGFPSEKKRWVSLQLAIPDTEWPIITSEHFYLEGSWVPHIVLPTPPISSVKKQEPRSDLQWKTIMKFVQQINCEGWLFYSEWLDDEMDRQMAKFYKDATEEFQVEASLKDFHHEITSYLLRDYRINCAKLVLQLGQRSQDGSINKQRDYEIETEIVRMHFEILRNLGIQREVLLNIEQSIGKIEHAHPELTPLKESVHLLAALLGPPGSWVQSLLFIGLLNRRLDVGVYVHCDSGLERTNLAFAVLLALKDMLAAHPFSELVAFAETYPHNEVLTERFKKLTWKYLSDVCAPLTHASPGWEGWVPDKARIDALLDAQEQKAL